MERRRRKSCGPVVIETRETGKVLARDRRRRVHEEETVGVCGITNNEDFDVGIGKLVEDLSLRHKDRSILLEEILSFHALLSGEGTNKHGHVHVLEGDARIGCGDDLDEQREGAILEFHHDPLQHLLRGRDVEQMQDHGLVFAEHDAAADHGEERVSDLPGGARHEDSERGSLCLSWA